MTPIAQVDHERENNLETSNSGSYFTDSRYGTNSEGSGRHSSDHHHHPEEGFDEISRRERHNWHFQINPPRFESKAKVNDGSNNWQLSVDQLRYEVDSEGFRKRDDEHHRNM